jgi:hypothetical protein
MSPNAHSGSLSDVPKCAIGLAGEYPNAQSGTLAPASGERRAASGERWEGASGGSGRVVGGGRRAGVAASGGGGERLAAAGRPRGRRGRGRVRGAWE